MEPIGDQGWGSLCLGTKSPGEGVECTGNTIGLEAPKGPLKYTQLVDVPIWGGFPCPAITHQTPRKLALDNWWIRPDHVSHGLVVAIDR